MDAYYSNLIRTHSKNLYTLAPSTSPVLSSDDDMDSNRSSSPRMDIQTDSIMHELSPSTESKEIHSHQTHGRPQVEASTVLIDKATLSPRISRGPTVEQNMAFAALRGPQAERHTSSNISFRPSTFTEETTKGEKRSVEQSVESTERRVRPRADDDLI